MKVGIIGGGMIVQVHGPVILKQKEAELVGIADRDLARARAVAAALGRGNVYADAAEMIDREKPDVVHVLTPPSTHRELAVMAMEKGCHVLVEKPMALTLADAKAMAEAAERLKVRLCVNHNLLYEPTVAKARALAASGRIGRIVSADAYFSFNLMRNPSAMEDGAELCHWVYRLNGGPLQDQMPHMASLIFEFVEELGEVTRVQQCRGLLPGGWPDEVRVLVGGGGRMGLITISFGERPDTTLLTIRGTLGTIQANLFNGVLTVQRQSKLPRAASRGLSGFQTGWQNTKGAFANVWNFATGRVDKSNGIEALVRGFYEAIRTGGAPPVAMDRALRTVELIERVWPEPAVKRAEAPAEVSVTPRPAPTALVTGASGFLGSHLLRKLQADGVRTRVLLRPNSMHAGRMRPFDAEIVPGDLGDREAVRRAMQGIRLVYHAGSAMDGSWHNHEETTIKGTGFLMESALEQGVDRFVFISTLAVYELVSLANGAGVKEDGAYQEHSRLMGPYAHCKIEAEKMLFQAHREKGLPVTVIRPGVIIGPTGRVFFPHLGLKNGDTLFIVIGNGAYVLPLTYVENCVDGIRLASLSPKAVGRAYNLVDEGQVTVNDYLQAFVRETKIPAKIVHVPYALPYLAFGTYELVAAMGLLPKGKTSRRQLRYKTRRVLFDNTRAREDLGWTMRVPMDEGMKRTFAWYAQKFGIER